MHYCYVVCSPEFNMLHMATELATAAVNVPSTMGRHMDKGIQTVNINR